MDESTFFRQERVNTCVVASLRSVLATQFGIRIPEAVLRFAGDDATAPIVRHGATSMDLRRMLTVANRAANAGPRWRLRVKREAVVKDLAAELVADRYPLVVVHSVPPMLHMIVVIGYKPGRVRYFDPADGKMHWVGSGAFRRMWTTDQGRWMGVVVGD